MHDGKKVVEYSERHHGQDFTQIISNHFSDYSCGRVGPLNSTPNAEPTISEKITNNRNLYIL